MNLRSKLKPFSSPVPAAGLVDVVFLLLIFFLLTNSFVFHPGIPVELPRGQAATMSTAEKIVVTITSEGHLFFNDAPIPWHELERHLAELAFRSKRMAAGRLNLPDGEKPGPEYTPRVLLRADRGVEYKHVLTVMDTARAHDLGVTLATERAQEAP